MPAHAPAPAVQAERQRGQSARAAHYNGTAALAGRELRGQLHLGEVKPETDAGTGNVYLVQRGSIVVLKADLESAPKRDAVIKVGTEDFLVERTAGQSAHEPAWVICFYRLPPKL